MPVDWKDYPSNWRDIRNRLCESVGWKCQGCGNQCRLPGEPFDSQRRTLTVHHPDHDTENPQARLIPLCAPCHLRADAKHHARKARENRLRRRGQLTIKGVG